MSAVIKHTDDGIRPMLEGDLDEVVAIEQSIYQFPWTRGIFHDCLHVGYASWVLQVDGEIVAYAILSIAAEEAHVLTLCVKPAVQRQGYGRSLMQHMLDTAQERHANAVYLEVRPSNQGAITLYQKMGFNEVGIRPDYYPAENGREDAMIMACNLS